MFLTSQDGCNCTGGDWKCSVYFVSTQSYQGWIEGSGHADCFSVQTGAFDCSVHINGARYYRSSQSTTTINPTNCGPSTCAGGGLATWVLVLLCVLAALLFIGGGGFLIYWFVIRGETTEMNVFREGLTEEDKVILSQQP
jgi:hypothetical protein